ETACESAASARASALAGSSPFAMASRRTCPYSVRVLAWVATAPTPARTHGTPLPTHGTRVVTATPTSPVRGSIAAIENVWNSRASRELTPHATGSCATRGKWARKRPGQLARTVTTSFVLITGDIGRESRAEDVNPFESRRQAVRPEVGHEVGLI